MSSCGDLLILTVGGGIICIMFFDDIVIELWLSEEIGVWLRVVVEKFVIRKAFLL